MVKKLFPAILMLLCLKAAALDPLPQEAARARLASLEGLLAANRSLVEARWQELKRIDKLILSLWSESSEFADDESSAYKSEKMLESEERLSQLHMRRLSILQQIHMSYEEEKAISEQITVLRESLANREQVLDGRWFVTLMPSEQKGEIILTQNGTIVEGEYRLDGGQSGNVQGTFVRGHLVLERIDAQYGRMGKFEAQLMKDQNSLKGSWYSYDLASGQPLVGALVMERPAREATQ
ncbi:MAG TPA: hypothetical protein PK747_11305 [Acidobacteriota bacterium]|mgnify:CR=1 FL=1|nr:hypothetical protein [Acidobacteriota bacterium]HNT18762.1 hypothetical protein [Acidobacteriota bacterium]HPA27987.1 hypothetical protein [Acidobacteriota bacterium]HQO21304.1 hypothetical protein [Acidobacteriota bacterium]HQQ47975.1 hypothetical protein [Acidobacteriota bacterium]